MIARRLTIRGRVQGVGFRFHMRAEAVKLGVGGWVRNRRDGTVEAVVQGEAVMVDGLIGWARRGPAGAHVTDVEIHDAAAGEYSDYEIRPSA